MSPRTTHIGIPYHLSYSKVNNLEIKAVSVGTDQVADQFTKDVCQDKFERARKKFNGVVIVIDSPSLS